MKQKPYTYKKTAFGWGVWSNEKEKFVHTFTGPESYRNAQRRAKQLNSKGD